MAVTYTDENKYPLLDSGSSNWGAVANAVYIMISKGFELTLEAGENLSQHDCVCMKTDGKMYKADADDLTLLPPLGFVPYAITSGQEGKVRGFGWIDFNASWAVAASLSFSPGDLVFASSTAGQISKTRHSSNQLNIGMAKGETNASFITRILINPVHEPTPKNIYHYLYKVEDLGAGSDIANREFFVHPKSIELLSVGILAQGASAGIDDSNTCVINIQDDAGNSIISKTYNTTTTYPDNDYEDLGGLNATHKLLDAGEHLEFDITNGTNANPPAFFIVIEYVIRS